MNGMEALLSHLVPFLAILGVILLFYCKVAWKDIKPEEAKVEITANTIQNTISTGITAVSILLPLTVGILGFAKIQNNIVVGQLFWACIFFTLSLFLALYNLNRFPGMVNVYNLANDKPTGLLQIIQLFSLFYGVIYLVWGAWRILRL